MIFGDPYKFAIHCDIVNEWNADHFWVNGIYNIFIDGHYISQKINASELKFALANFSEEILLSLGSVFIQDENIDNIFFDKNSLNISSPEMEDENILICFAKNESKDFILLKNKESVTSFAYEKDYILNILLSVSKWSRNNMFEGR